MAHVIVVGAGPAGASLAYLLARHGIHVTLIERRIDFSREFRGEILMPSGIAALRDIGLGKVLDQVPARPLRSFRLYMNRKPVFTELIDPATLPGLEFIAVSQPALLQAIIDDAGGSDGFRFERGASLRGLVTDAGRVRGVRVRIGDEERELTADLVVGADGRNSAVRRLAGLAPQEETVPMDIVWCKLPCPEDWEGVRAFIGRGHLLIAYRTWDDSLQLGWVILKGTFGELRSRGIEYWIESMAQHVDPPFADHLRTHREATRRPFLLDTVADCVSRWSRPGVLVIGDAAHTMSPVGGQGINIALRDSIVAANHLAPVLTAARPDEDRLNQALARIETERMAEVRPIQSMQALPPKLILSRAWWAEPLRRLATGLLGRRAGRIRAAARLSAFAFGVSDVSPSV